MNNLKHIWSILCTNSSVDQKTNNISLFNVLEQIGIDKKAFEMAKNSQKNLMASINFQLITLWKKEDENTKFKTEQRVEVIDAGGKILASILSILDIPEKQTRIRVINSFNGLPITSTGEYLFKIALKYEKNDKFVEITSVPLMVKENPS